MSRLLYLLPLLIFAVIAGYFTIPILTKKDPRLLPSVLIDKPAPGHDLPALLQDKPGLGPEDLKGEVKLVNFFASWCGPCRAEHPILMRLAAEGAVPLVGINYKDRPEAAIGWLRELGDPFGRIGTDSDGRAAIDWGVYGVPETYLVDAAGHIRYRHVGPLTGQALNDTLLPMVEQLRAGKG
ncbi:DsbE family thiol:disulfide interchange protein [Nisaea sediminum]|uniref:DsbE family thiol:disulfide interchange protein n=1 Tax=Nisaea sediminum TaxID=2775867 RepID=UPI001866A95C|nr:DsbE family thiol:disulfide interchange protein [Nisaea sediminum]